LLIKAPLILSAGLFNFKPPQTFKPFSQGGPILPVLFSFSFFLRFNRRLQSAAFFLDGIFDKKPAGYQLFRGVPVVFRQIDKNIRVPAEFSGSVDYACLSAYQQASYFETSESKKDFEDRVPGVV
jgi:hypothetical protein